MTLVDAFAEFIGRVPYREVSLPSGPARVWDTGSGRPLVLLHGLAGSRRVFHRVVPLLEGRRRVVVPNLRGEDLPPREATLDGLHQDLDALLAGLELREVTLGGVSFGGVLALAHAARGDPRIADVVVQGAFARFHLRLGDRLALALSRFAPPMLGSRYFAWRVLRGPEARLIREHAPGLEVLLADWSAKTPFRTVRERTRLIARTDLSSQLARIGVPVTIAHGDRDRVVPRSYHEELGRLLPGARRVWWTGIGHLAVLTHPQQFAALFGD